MAVSYEDREMSLVEHLDELRSRLIYCLWAVAAGTGIVWFWAAEVMDWMARPVGGLVFLHPTEAFFTRVKIALYGGFLLALPVVIYQVWAFVARALGEKVRRVLGLLIPASYVLFLFGVLLAFVWIIPMATKVLVTFGTAHVTPLLSAGEYTGFVETVSLSFGLVFQLPLVLIFLDRIGVVTRRGLAGKRRVVYFVCLLGGTALAPVPDIMGQMSVFIPLVVLFELSMVAMWWLDRQDAKG